MQSKLVSSTEFPLRSLRLGEISISSSPVNLTKDV